MKHLYCAVIALLIAAHVAAAPLEHGDLATFPTRDGVTQSIFIESPSPNRKRVASTVLTAGA